MKTDLEMSEAEPDAEDSPPEASEVVDDEKAPKTEAYESIKASNDERITKKRGRRSVLNNLICTFCDESQLYRKASLLYHLSSSHFHPIKE